MRLTLYTDYALRLLLTLAAPGVGRTTISEVALGYGIARNHLTKVAYELGTLGLIKTSRGKGGGLALARPAESINLGAIVRATEGDFALVPCKSRGIGACRIFPACRLHHALEQATEAFLAVLDGYTLADLADGDIAPLLWPNMAVPGTG